MIMFHKANTKLVRVGSQVQFLPAAPKATMNPTVMTFLESLYIAPYCGTEREPAP